MKSNHTNIAINLMTLVQDFYNVWLFHADIDISEIRMQETEVISIQWVDRDGLIDMMHRGKLHPMIDYIEEMF